METAPERGDAQVLCCRNCEYSLDPGPGVEKGVCVTYESLQVLDEARRCPDFSPRPALCVAGEVPVPVAPAPILIPLATAADLLDVVKRLLREDAEGEYTIGLIEDARAAVEAVEGRS